jgi:hypothetical protein
VLLWQRILTADHLHHAQADGVTIYADEIQAALKELVQIAYGTENTAGTLLSVEECWAFVLRIMERKL